MFIYLIIKFGVALELGGEIQGGWRMSRRKIEFTIIGAGNGGQAIALHLSALGHNADLCDVSKEVRRQEDDPFRSRHADSTR